jgi:hypothetical protein
VSKFKKLPASTIHFEDCDNLIFVIGNRKYPKKHKYEIYRREGCKKLVSTIFEELIQRTWEPKRARDWCWDEDEKKFMSDYVR